MHEFDVCRSKNINKMLHPFKNKRRRKRVQTNFSIFSHMIYKNLFKLVRYR
jgi:hypothetical protein